MLFALVVLTSAIHFGDNAFRLDLYPGPAWLTRNTVLFLWMIVLSAACLAYWKDTRSALILYAILGFAGLAHFVMPHKTSMPVRCIFTIVAETLASGLLIAYALRRPTRNLGKNLAAVTPNQVTVQQPILTYPSPR